MNCAHTLDNVAPHNAPSSVRVKALWEKIGDIFCGCKVPLKINRNIKYRDLAPNSLIPHLILPLTLTPLLTSVRTVGYHLAPLATI